jgi:formamidopyrimidine-DNA glycosylase
MPELPDVEGFKAQLERTSLSQEIVSIRAPDPRVLKDTSVQGLAGKLKGRQFKDTCRWGKFLFISVEDQCWLVLHFGMTGQLAYYPAEEQAPGFECVVFEFGNRQRLSYLSQRKLGRVSWTADIGAYAAARELGPDAMSAELTYSEFKRRLREHRTLVKSGLMNQSTLAGIGNIWGDEILFQAGVPPKVRIGDIGEKDMKKLYSTMRRVLRTGSRAMRENRPFPRTYMVPHRDGDQLCPKCKTELHTVKVSGRTSFYCPRCQGAAPGSKEK